MPEYRAFVASGTARQPQLFVVAAGDDLNTTQAMDQWLATTDPVEVRR